MVISAFERAENTVGRRENASYLHFLQFPQCFQKLSVYRVKALNCAGQKVNHMAFEEVLIIWWDKMSNNNLPLPVFCSLPVVAGSPQLL